MPPVQPHPRTENGVFAAGVFAAVLVLAAVARMAVWPQVLVAGELMPQGGDSAYHLHRTLLVAADFPRVPGVDPLMAWPTGGSCHWAPGYDVLSALPVVLLGASADPDRAAIIAALFPVAAGLLLVALTVWTARRLLPATALGRGGSLAAGVLVAVHPQAVSISRFGRTDHHVLEALGMAALGLWSLHLAAPELGRQALRWRAGLELVGAATAALALWTFAGAYLYVAIACVGIAAARLSTSPGGSATPWLGSGALAMVVAAGLIATSFVPTIAHHGQALSYVNPSWVQPALLVAAAAGFLLLTLALRLVEGTGWSAAGRRLGIVLPATAAAALVAAVALPDLTGQLTAGARDFVGTADPWLANIAEFQPLLSGPAWRISSWAPAYDQGAALGALSALVLPGGLWVLAHRGDRASSAAFILWTVAVAALALAQQRFGRIATVNLAICAALLVELALRPLAKTRPHAWVLPTAAALLVVLLVPRSRGFLRLAETRDPSALEQAALFLDQRATGPVAGHRDGVLLPWDWGHLMIWLAGRPVVATGFGTYLDAPAFAEVEAAWLGTPLELDALMARRDLGFVVAGAASMSGRVAAPGAALPFRRLPDGRGVVDPAWLRGVPLGGLVVAGSGLPDGSSHHLASLRPVHASTATVGGLDTALPVLFTYQQVPGAVLSGAAQPGAPVLFELQLSLRGQPWPWCATTTAGPDGAWTLTLPVATDTVSGGIRTAPSATLRVGSNPPRELAIPLNAVLAGRSLWLPG